jgi:hypothetical protein
MGAIARQTLQVKRKNSTSCNPPEARLTVAGSVASRASPRGVTTTAGTTAGASVRAGASVCAAAASVAGGTAAGSEAVDGDSVGGVEAQATARRAITRLRLQNKRRGFIEFLLGLMILSSLNFLHFHSNF